MTCQHCGARLVSVYAGRGDTAEVDDCGSDLCAASPHGYHDPGGDDE